MSKRERLQVSKNSKSPTAILNQPKKPQAVQSPHPAEVIQNICMSSQSWQSTDIMQLQKTIGNRALSQLMQGAKFPKEQLPQTAQQEKPAQKATADQTAGSAPVQRMIAVADDLYLNSEQSGLKKDKEKSDWKDKAAELRDKTVTDIKPADFIEKEHIPAETQADVTAALNNCRNEFAYYYMSALKSSATLKSPVITRMLQPKDMLIEKADDLKDAYNQSKACALQALVNAGVEREGVEDTSDPEAWHNYYYKVRHMRYDEDPVIYQIYTELGLELVHNQSANWSTLKLKPGTYIFSSEGHNFCVEVNDSADAASKYVCHDEPQRRQTRYQADLVIRYVWKKP